jgi:hypothetical protein
MENIIVACVLTGLTCLLLGTVFGFVLGAAGRLFFQTGFTEFVREEREKAEADLVQQLQTAQTHANGLVAGAHQQATEIYKAAAAQALKSGLKIPVPPSSGGAN